MKKGSGEELMSQEKMLAEHGALGVIPHQKEEDRAYGVRSMRRMMMLGIVRHFNELIRRDPRLFNRMIETREPIPLDHRWHTPNEMLNDDPRVDVVAHSTRKSTGELEVSIGLLGMLNGLIRGMSSVAFPDERWVILLHFDKYMPQFASLRVYHLNGWTEDLREEDLMPAQESNVEQMTESTISREDEALISQLAEEEEKNRLMEESIQVHKSQDK